MIAFDLFQLDREVRSAVERRERALRALDRGDFDEGANPFHRLREVSSKARFVELMELPDDPLIEGLRSWVGYLTIERVTWPDRVRVAEAWHAPGHRSRALDGDVSAHELWHSILRESESAARRRDLAEELERAADPACAAARRASERRREAVRVLGTPIPAPTWQLDDGLVEDAAREILRETAPALEGSGAAESRGWQETFFEMLGRDAAEGWPATLRPRWLADLWNGSLLVAGLRLDVPTLPAALGATSFARALGLWGRAIAEADVPRDQAYCIARAPDDPLLGSRQSSFAALAAEPAFCRRVLGLGRAAAREQARRIARAMALSLRIDALRPLLWSALAESPARASTRAEEETAVALGTPLPPSLLGVLPKLGAERGRALVAGVLGASDRRRKREEFDEDWFSNPKAHEALREEHHRPASARAVTKDVLSEGLAALKHELGSALS